MIGIYKITNLKDGKSYVGQSINITKRWNQHKNEYQKEGGCPVLYVAIRKYKIENFSFEILEECPQELLNEKEIFWIAHYKSNDRDFGYNVLAGGQNGGVLYPNEWFYELWDAGFTVTEIQKELGVAHGTVRAKLEGYKDYNAHTSRSRGATKAIKEGKITGVNNLPFENVSVHQYDLLGNYVASFESAADAGRFFGAENGDNIRFVINDRQQTAYGFQWSKEKVKQMKPVPTHLGKLVECIETGQLFPSTVEAAKWAGLKSKSGVRECCVGIVKSAGKHPETGEKLHWRYYEDN